MFRAVDILWITALVAVLLAWGIAVDLLCEIILAAIRRHRKRKKGRKEDDKPGEDQQGSGDH